MQGKDDFVVGLDVGTHKVLCVVARPAPDGTMEVFGYGSRDSEGITEGTVTDVERTVQSIREAVEEAENTSHVRIERVLAGIGGTSLSSSNSVGYAVLRGKEVTASDRDSAEANARESSLRNGKEIIKTLRQDFVLDGRDGIVHPDGLFGQKLEAWTHVVYGSITAAENLKRCMQRVGLTLVDYEPQPWASARAVSTPDDRQLGCAVFDMGAGTSSCAIYTKGVLRYTAVWPWGAEYFTNDVATALGISIRQAESLKTQFGHCHPEEVSENDMASVEADLPGEADVEVPRKLLAATLRARAIEFMKLYAKVLVQSDCGQDVSRVILTGGGAQLPFLEEIAQDQFMRAVRIGRPQQVKGAAALVARPDASAAVGLALAACERLTTGEYSGGYRTRRLPSALERVKIFFLGNY